MIVIDLPVTNLYPNDKYCFLCLCTHHLSDSQYALTDPKEDDPCLKTYFHTCNCIKRCHSKSSYFKTLVYRLREVIMKMVCRLHSTYFIVNYIIFGSDSSYAN